MIMKQLIYRLHKNGFCDVDGKPFGNTKLFNLSIKDIITYGNQVLRGVMNGNQACLNYVEGWRIQYIIHYSIAKTLARKLNLSLRKVFKKFTDNLSYTYTNDKGILHTMKLALFKSFKWDKTFLPHWLTKIKQPIEFTYDCRNLLNRNCYICGNPQYSMMFHRKRKGLLHLPYTNIIKEMLRINRRQVCLCVHCFDKAEYNLLQFNQITRRNST